MIFHLYMLQRIKHISSLPSKAKIIRKIIAAQSFAGEQLEAIAFTLFQYDISCFLIIQCCQTIKVFIVLGSIESTDYR